MITLRKANRNDNRRIAVSIGILAWNEEEAVEATLRSLAQQIIFNELGQRGLGAEVLLVANGCTDRTAEVARTLLEGTSVVLANTPRSPIPEMIHVGGRVVEIAERGKNNAWNLFVHSLSTKDAACLFLMDADIVIRGDETLWNMYRALEDCPQASVAVDEPVKDILLKSRRSVMERISLATSGMTRTSSAQLTGQLYAIRASVARNIFLPRDLAACEDGFIKSLVCTDFLTTDSRPDRVVLAKGAAHVFQSYRRPGDVLRNQKRQMIGQTLVHLLVDRHLKELPRDERLHLASTLRTKEGADPDWLKKLTAQHLGNTKYFWRLFPNLLRFRYERWRALPPIQRLTHGPAALAGFAITLLASFQAFRFLKRGSLDYWPDTRSSGLGELAGRNDSSDRLSVTLSNQPL